MGWDILCQHFVDDNPVIECKCTVPSDPKLPSLGSKTTIAILLLQIAITGRFLCLHWEVDQLEFFQTSLCHTALFAILQQLALSMNRIVKKVSDVI